MHSVRYLCHFFLLYFACQKTALGQSTELPPVVKGCGGWLNLTAGEDIVIEYKLGEQLNHHNERCNWILQSDNQAVYYIKVTLLTHGFYQDGLALFAMDPLRSEMSSVEILMDEEIETILQPLTFLSFYQWNSFSNHGTGFQALVQLSVRDPVPFPQPKVSIFVFTTWTDYFRYPPSGGNYEANERAYLFINPPNFNVDYYHLYLDFMDIESSEQCVGDHLDLYEFTDIHEFRRVSRNCGTGPNSTDYMVRTPYNLLFEFSSGQAVTAQGFRVSWTQGKI